MRMSSRFIKNRLVDFGMIKPTEFLKKKNFFSCLYSMLFWSSERYCLCSNHLDQNWLYQGFHEWVQEGEQAERRSSLSSGFVFTSGTDVQYFDNPSSVHLIKLLQRHSGRFHLEMVHADNVIRFKLGSNQTGLWNESSPFFFMASRPRGTHRKIAEWSWWEIWITSSFVLKDYILCCIPHLLRNLHNHFDTFIPCVSGHLADIFSGVHFCRVIIHLLLIQTPEGVVSNDL